MDDKKNESITVEPVFQSCDEGHEHMVGILAELTPHKSNGETASCSVGGGSLRYFTNYDRVDWGN